MVMCGLLVCVVDFVWCVMEFASVTRQGPIVCRRVNTSSDVVVLPKGVKEEGACCPQQVSREEARALAGARHIRVL